MTIQTSNSKTIALGNGSATQFAFGFVGVAAAYIGVIYTDANGNETVLTQGSGTTQYQITLNAAPVGGLWGTGGSVTFNPNGTPIAAGTTLTIFRTLPLTQAISLQNQISLSALGNGAETGLDTLEMQLQQVYENIARAIVAPIVDATAPGPLPPIAQRANMGMAFDANGNPIAAAIPGTGIISSAMQPVVDASTLALGRAAFGLGTASAENVGSYGLTDDGAGNLRQSYPTVADATNQSVTSAFHLTQRVATAPSQSIPLVYTLPQANTLFNGFGFWIFSEVGNVELTPNAGDNFDTLASGVSVAVPQGSWAWVTTNAANSGVWHIAYNSENTSLQAAVAGNALTITLNATALKFRDPTLTQGDQIAQNIPANLSITVPNGATLATPGSNTAFRVWVLVARNGGNPVLGVAVATAGQLTIYPLGAWEALANTGTAISTASDNAGQLYTSSAVANDVVRLLGYVNFGNGQATAGTWATAPTKVQNLSPGMKLPGDVVQMTTANSGLSITPTSKENLTRVRATATNQLGTSGAVASAQFTRNASPIGIPQLAGVTSNAFTTSMPISMEMLDTPFSTSSVAYSLSLSTGTLTGLVMIVEELMA